MLKENTIHLLDEELSFKTIFSICIGQSYLYQSRFIQEIGEYNRWDTFIKEGLLRLDDRDYHVEYIGTTSLSDGYWYSSELETMIPDAYVSIMMNTRQILESLGIPLLTDGEIALSDDINGYNLSMIYIAFARENVAYFCGSGETSIYMFVKDLPEHIFKKITPKEFSTLIVEIISSFNVNHFLLVQSILFENDIEYTEENNSITVRFDDGSIITIEFTNNNITNLSGHINE